MSLLTPLFALGLDSAACCMAIGTIALSSGERFRLALAFGACDMAASIVAYPLPASHAFAVYPCCAARQGRALLYGLPLLLGLDNLVAGAAPAQALVDGMGSMLLALLGLATGAFLSGGFRPGRRERPWCGWNARG